MFEGSGVQLIWLYFVQFSRQLTLLRLYPNNTIDLTQGPFPFFKDPTICKTGTSFVEPWSLLIRNATRNLSGTYRLTDGNKTADIFLTGL